MKKISIATQKYHLLSSVVLVMKFYPIWHLHKLPPGQYILRFQSCSTLFASNILHCTETYYLCYSRARLDNVLIFPGYFGERSVLPGDSFWFPRTFWLIKNSRRPFYWTISREYLILPPLRRRTCSPPRRLGVWILEGRLSQPGKGFARGRFGLSNSAARQEAADLCG